MTYLVPTNRIAREIDSMVSNFMNFPGFRTEGSSDFTPRVNIRENQDDVFLTFELPGMERKDIKVTIKDNVLTVSGNREFKHEEQDRGFVRTEISTGSFSRSFTLPDTVSGDKISADYKNGLLEVKLPKKEEVKPKEIEVQVS